MKNKTTQFDRFKHYSQQAAKLEQKEEWNEAAVEWSIAKLNAPTEKDRQWCEYRQAFCKRRQFINQLPEVK